MINPNGVLFGQGSKVDMPALVASTMNISDADFLAGNYRFTKEGKGSYVINQGDIHIRNGGYVCLLAQAVENSGVIEAALGKVVLAAGEALTLSLDDQGDISVVIDEAVKQEVLDPNRQPMDSAVKNTGSILADGGKVILTAKVLNHVFDYAINNSGVVVAQDIIERDGVVELITHNSSSSTAPSSESTPGNSDASKPKDDKEDKSNKHDSPPAPVVEPPVTEPVSPVTEPASNTTEPIPDTSANQPQAVPTDNTTPSDSSVSSSSTAPSSEYTTGNSDAAAENHSEESTSIREGEIGTSSVELPIRETVAIANDTDNPEEIVPQKNDMLNSTSNDLINVPTEDMRITPNNQIFNTGHYFLLNGIINVFSVNFIIKKDISVLLLESKTIPIQIDLVSEDQTTAKRGNPAGYPVSGLILNGGRVNLTNEKTFGNKNMFIYRNISSISRNSGYMTGGALEQLGFFGILSSRAPPQFNIFLAPFFDAARQDFLPSVSSQEFHSSNKSLNNSNNSCKPVQEFSPKNILSPFCSVANADTERAFIFNPSQKSSKGYNPPDEWYCIFSARDESLDFSPGRFNNPSNALNRSISIEFWAGYENSPINLNRGANEVIDLVSLYGPTTLLFNPAKINLELKFTSNNPIKIIKNKNFPFH